MSNYTITTNFGAKDSLPSGNAGKVIKGSEFTTEFTNIQTAVATKADTVSPTFTGAVTFDAAVTVNSTATITGDLTVDTNTLFVDVSENKVGIGTDSPTQKLQVDGNIRLGDTAVGVDDDEDYNITTGGQLTIHANDSGNNIDYTGLIFDVGNASGAQAASSRVKFKVNNTERMRIDSSGNVGIGTDSPDYALDVDGTIASRDAYLITANSSGTPSAGAFMFRPASNTLALGTNSTERMRIDSSGNVGIGTNNPQRKLHVQDGDIRIESTFPRLYLTDTDNNSDYSIINNNGKFSIYDDTNTTYRMTIDSSGNVGIGTDSPTAKFGVSATAPTYTNLGTVLWGGTTNNDNHTGISLSSSGDALGGSVGSNLYYSNSNTATQSNTNRSSGEIKIDNTTGTGTSAIRLGGYAKGTTTFNEHMRIDSSGNLLVDTTNIGATGGGFSFRAGSVNYMNIAHASSVGHGNYFAAFKHNDTVIGTITKTNTTGVSYNTSSDERLKENITDSADAGSKVDAIQIRQYDWKADGTHQDYGVIAQELVEVAPEAVHQPVDEEDMMGVDYSKLVPMLIKEVQSLRSRVAELENV